MTWRATKIFHICTTFSWNLKNKLFCNLFQGHLNLFVFLKKILYLWVFEKIFACGFLKWHFFRILTQYLKLAIANIENSSYVCMKDSLLLNTKGLIYSGPSSGGALKIRMKCNIFVIW